MYYFDMYRVVEQMGQLWLGQVWSYPYYKQVSQKGTEWSEFANVLQEKSVSISLFCLMSEIENNQYHILECEKGNTCIRIAKEFLGRLLCSPRHKCGSGISEVHPEFGHTTLITWLSGSVTSNKYQGNSHSIVGL